MKRIRRTRDSHYDAWAPIEMATQLVAAWRRANPGKDPRGTSDG